MYCKSIVLLACLVGAALGHSWPALLWGFNSSAKPALYTLSQDEFADVLEPATKNSMIVVFLEPELSNMDFTCSKSNAHHSCYSNLEGTALKTFYRSVKNPTEAIRQLSPDREWVTVDVNGNLEYDVVWQAGKIVMVDLGAISEVGTLAISRPALLELHDEIMAKVFNTLSNKGKITAVYTRTQSTTDVTKNRRRRATDSATSGTMFRSNKDFLIFFTELATKQPPKQGEKPDQHSKTAITISEMNLSDKNDTAFTVNLNGKDSSGAAVKMSFLISLAVGYFKMSNMMLNEESFYVPSEINSPTNFSYSCGNQTFSSMKADSQTIIMWNSLQMQAPFNSATPDNFSFGDAWYCVGFFSSGILAGLFVVFILLGILSVGICWMLDINTMDRFDDPKGKTITINVNE